MSDDTANPLRFTCDQGDAGGRLDAALARYLHVSTNEARRVLQRAAVRVDGRRVTQRDKGNVVHVGTAIEVAHAVRDADAVPAATNNVTIDVLAERDGLVIINKPAGVAVHPLRHDETTTLLNAAVARWPDMIGVGEGGLRSGVVHRLDVDTSGAMALAITQDAWRQARAAIESHTATKTYHALVKGHLEGEGREVMQLVVAQHRPARVRVVDDPQHAPAGARRCDLTWRSLEQLQGHTLIEVHLGTGFLHQIRVMLAALGHPVAGDRLYGDSDNLPRHMLHANSLTIDGLTGVAPYPEDFQTQLASRRRM